MITEEDVIAARLRYEELRSAYDDQQVREIVAWDQEDLLAAAEECGDESGDDHCWRCFAWTLYNQREESLRKANCAHPENMLKIKDGWVVCKNCDYELSQVTRNSL